MSATAKDIQFAEDLESMASPAAFPNAFRVSRAAAIAELFATCGEPVSIEMDTYLERFRAGRPHEGAPPVYGVGVAGFNAMFALNAGLVRVYWSRCIDEHAPPGRWHIGVMHFDGRWRDFPHMGDIETTARHVLAFIMSGEMTCPGGARDILERMLRSAEAAKAEGSGSVEGSP
jgi:hypothetical protein